MLPCALSDIYSVTNAGKDTIYMTYMSDTLDLINYLQTNGIVKKSANEQENGGNGLQNDTTMVTDTNVVNQTNQTTNPQQTGQPGQTQPNPQTPQQ